MADWGYSYGDFNTDDYDTAGEWSDALTSLDMGGLASDLDGSKAAERQKAANDENWRRQQQLAQDAQDFFKKQSDAGIEAIQAGTDQAAGAINSGLSGATSQIGEGRDLAADALQEGSQRNLGALAQGFGQGRSDIQGGIQQARGDLYSAYNQARGDLGRVQGLQQYGAGATRAIGAYDVAGQAPDRLGSMVDRGLYSGFQEDPGYKFRQQQGEEAIQRQAAATGGRNSGATMKALADYNQGLASQEYGNFTARRQAEAGIAGQADSQRLGALMNQAGRSDAAALAAQGNQYGLAQMGYGAQGQLAGMAQQQGQNLGNLAAQGGQALGGMAYGYGAQRGGVYNQGGQNLSDLYSSTYGMNAGLTYGAGQSLGDLYYNSGAGQANIGIGVGANGMNTTNSLMGASNDALNNNLAIEQNQQTQKNGLITGILGAVLSDARLKYKIETVAGSKYEKLGLRGVRWEWNNTANKLGLFGRSEGVIAQDVREKYPRAVTEIEGYLAVNYRELDHLVDEASR